MRNADARDLYVERLSPDGTKAIVCLQLPHWQKEAFALCCVRTGAQLWPRWLQGDAAQVAWSPDGHYLAWWETPASWHHGHKIVNADSESGRIMIAFCHHIHVDHVTWAPDACSVALSGSTAGTNITPPDKLFLVSFLP